MRLVDYLDKGASLDPAAPCLTTDGEIRTQKYVIGANWYPKTWLNLATQYYSQNPLQVLQIPGSAGCTCAQCTAIADVAAGRVSSAASPKTTTPVVVKPLELQSFAEAKKSASVVAQAKASAVHIDGSLLHTIASASGKPMVTIRRGRK